MDIAAATTTGDILGLALLATLSEKPSSRIEVVDAARALCLPWLTPTREVVAGLLNEFCKAGQVRVAKQGVGEHWQPDSAPLEMTPQGEQELRRLVLYRTARPAHPLAILCESLRLSVVDRLDPCARGEVIRGQIRARRRCLAMQHRRLIKAGTESSTLVQTLHHQIACAQAEFDVLASASRSGAGGGASLVHSHRRRIACAQEESDSLTEISREEESGGIPFLPFST